MSKDISCLIKYNEYRALDQAEGEGTLIEEDSEGKYHATQRVLEVALPLIEKIEAMEDFLAIQGFTFDDEGVTVFFCIEEPCGCCDPSIAAITLPLEVG
jgi:hypothetical protein